MCRSRRELSNAYLLAKIGVDTAENEPLEVWGQNSIQYSLHSLISAREVGLGEAVAGDPGAPLGDVPGRSRGAPRPRALAVGVRGQPPPADPEGRPPSICDSVSGLGLVTYVLDVPFHHTGTNISIKCFPDQYVCCFRQFCLVRRLES